MLVDVSNIPVTLDALLPENEELLSKEVSHACGCTLSLAPLNGEALARGTFRIRRRSIDARKKSNVHFVITVVANVTSFDQLSLAKGVNAKEHVPPKPLEVLELSSAAKSPDFKRPIIVGAGPAGLFCAYYLAKAGLQPWVVERGKSVDERMTDIDAFANGDELNPNSNVQFGEGGAGTFSDGKLNTGTKDPRIRNVLQAFVDAGAPTDILVNAKPHIGTDLLPGIIRTLRQSIEADGGEFSFNTQLIGIAQPDGELHVRLRNVETGEAFEAETDALALAIGHSARDTYEMLRDAGISMERKPFAVGVRIEHPQEVINETQYGKAAGHPALGAADYKLAVHNEDGRGVYTFCMCPGGTVVTAASEQGRVCVNGMSSHARDGRNANSALLVGVNPDDLPGDDVLEGIRLQRDMESAAYDLGLAASGVPFTAPAQTVGDFLDIPEDGNSLCSAKVSRLASDCEIDGELYHRFLALQNRSTTFTEQSELPTRVEPSYPRGVAWVDLHGCLPNFVSAAMEEALPALDRKLPGFANPKSVMTGVEARSSSPVKMTRSDGTKESISTPGVYPAGEGAGYAGGIMSAAVDGLRVAEAIAVSYGAGLWRDTGKHPETIKCLAGKPLRDEADDAS